MRRILVLLATMLVGAMVASGVAYAQNDVECDGPGDTDPDPLECRGTHQSDEIIGTTDEDGEEIRALAGKDFVDAFDGDDTVYGGPDGDGSARQNPWWDGLDLEGAEDSDTVYGQLGPDVIDAANNDTEGSFDRSFGGKQNDHIYSVDGEEDFVDCGLGPGDVARIDQGIDSAATNCETVIRRD